MQVRWETSDGSQAVHLRSMTGLTLAHEYYLNSMLPELHVQRVWVPMRKSAVSHPQSQVGFRGAFFF